MSYWKNGEPDWRRFEQMARRGWGRMARMANDELGNMGNWGGNLRVGRMLASGDLRLVALYLIEQQPRHGYDLIKAVEEKSNGVYSPSPGIVYPALTYLEALVQKLLKLLTLGQAPNRQTVEKTWLLEQIQAHAEFKNEERIGQVLINLDRLNGSMQTQFRAAYALFQASPSGGRERSIQTGICCDLRNMNSFSATCSRSSRADSKKRWLAS